MREVQIGTQNYTKIVASDEKGAGGANHQYYVYTEIPNETPQGFCTMHWADISFQNGAIKENGVNGCHNEDLIAIVIDRLQEFQRGDFACRENAIALTKLEESMMWLNKRTNDRIKRGVEGISVK